MSRPWSLCLQVSKQKVVPLAEYKASFEELNEEGEEEKKELFLNEALNEVEEGLDKGQMLVIR